MLAAILQHLVQPLHTCVASVTEPYGFDSLSSVHFRDELWAIVYLYGNRNQQEKVSVTMQSSQRPPYCLLSAKVTQKSWWYFTPSSSL